MFSRTLLRDPCPQYTQGGSHRGSRQKWAAMSNPGQRNNNQVVAASVPKWTPQNCALSADPLLKEISLEWVLMLVWAIRHMKQTEPFRKCLFLKLRLPLASLSVVNRGQRFPVAPGWTPHFTNLVTICSYDHGGPSDLSRWRKGDCSRPLNSQGKLRCF